MIETLSPILPDAVDAAARRLPRRACIGGGPVRIECLRGLDMLSEAL